MNNDMAFVCQLQLEAIYSREVNLSAYDRTTVRHVGNEFGSGSFQNDIDEQTFAKQTFRNL